MDQEIKTITINGVGYVEEGSHVQSNSNSPIRIVVLQRGWVMVGRYEREGDNCKLHNAKVVRVWGTKKGLGEIAADGPTSSTILDATNGLVEFHRLTEVLTINCNEEKWAKELK